MALSLHGKDCLDVLFGGGDSDAGKLGTRLGVPYMRAQQPVLEVRLRLRRLEGGGEEELILSFTQSSLGLCAISGVVWDAGLLMVDFLAQQERSLQQQTNCCGDSGETPLVPMALGKVLELGTGTGVVGVCCSLLGSCNSVLSTDAVLSDLLLENIEHNHNTVGAGAGRHSAVVSTLQFSWGSDAPPVLGQQWDSVLCSDVLYDDKFHAQLLQTLLHLQYKRLYIGYKCRNMEKEKEFMASLQARVPGRVRVVEGGSVQLLNLHREQLGHLYIIVVDNCYCDDTATEES